jgi:hypothetical protein
MEPFKCAYKLEEGKECGRETNESFRFESVDYYFCNEHRMLLAEQVSGKVFKEPPKPKT